MRVVSDTSPISNLAIIGRLEFLKRLHGTIIIPPAVREELARLHHPQARAAVEDALADGWIRVERPPTIRLQAKELHAGEIEAITLALEPPGALLLIDEAEGRIAARNCSIKVTGAIGVLIAARRNDWIPALKPELLALRKKARFHIAERFLIDVLAAAGETLP